jgi:hypothetical protein
VRPICWQVEKRCFDVAAALAGARIGSCTLPSILGALLLFCVTSVASSAVAASDTPIDRPPALPATSSDAPVNSSDANAKNAATPSAPSDPLVNPSNTNGAPSATGAGKPSDTREKDIWDKAQIISGFLAAVVLAGVGILINSSIQRAQIKTSAENTNAQIEVAKRNNDAQLALATRSADVQRQIQQSTLAAQLVEQLASDSALKKQLAIVALRRSLQPEMYEEIITIVVKSDPDPEVRMIALGQAAKLPSAEPSVVHVIAEAAKDSSRSGEERKIATDAVQHLGLRSIAPSGTFVFASSSGLEHSHEDDKLGGGVFTYYLLRGLSGAAATPESGSVRTSELATYIQQSVLEYTRGNQSPTMSAFSAEGDPILVGPTSQFTKTVVIAIGNSEYSSSIVTLLRYAASDAKQFAELYDRQGASVHLVQNATREGFMSAVQSAIQQVDDRSLLIFYYAGHAMLDGGVFWLLPVDADMDLLKVTGIATEQLKESIFRAPAGARVLFLDTSFSGQAGLR